MTNQRAVAINNTPMNSDDDGEQDEYSAITNPVFQVIFNCIWAAVKTPNVKALLVLNGTLFREGSIFDSIVAKTKHLRFHIFIGTGCGYNVSSD